MFKITTEEYDEKQNKNKPSTKRRNSLENRKFFYIFFGSAINSYGQSRNFAFIHSNQSKQNNFFLFSSYLSEKEKYGQK